MIIGTLFLAGIIIAGCTQDSGGTPDQTGTVAPVQTTVKGTSAHQDGVPPVPSGTSVTAMMTVPSGGTGNFSVHRGTGNESEKFVNREDPSLAFPGNGSGPSGTIIGNNGEKP